MTVEDFQLGMSIIKDIVLSGAAGYTVFKLSKMQELSKIRIKVIEECWINFNEFGELIKDNNDIFSNNTEISKRLLEAYSTAYHSFVKAMLYLPEVLQKELKLFFDLKFESVQSKGQYDQTKKEIEDYKKNLFTKNSIELNMREHLKNVGENKENLQKIQSQIIKQQDKILELFRKEFK